MLTIGSLCSGYGGLDMGLALALGAPIRHAWHVEYDAGPSKILAHRFPGVPNYGDVKTTDWSVVAPIDWLTAGYPCQPFSLAGLRKGVDDPRHLWPDVARAICVLRPRGVVLENVAAHLRVGFDTVLGDLAEMGYDARWGLVRASDAGAPHRRSRLFVVATHAGSEAVGQRPGLRPSDASGVGRGRPHDDRASAPPTDADRPGRGGLAEFHARTPTGVDSEHRGYVDGRRDGADWGAGKGEGAADTDGAGLERVESAGGRIVPAWGAYEPAVRRWEQVTGRSAPGPTEPARNGERLSPRFVEWMMGLPDGWVTDVPGLARNARLKALGNGVVPQQAALALRLLGPTACEVAA